VRSTAVVLVRRTKIEFAPHGYRLRAHAKNGCGGHDQF
jgi:hypothetical protein